MSNFGVCDKCGKSTRPTRLYGAGVCFAHSQEPDTKIERTDLKEIANATKAANKTLDVWFKEQEAQRPKACECGCGKPLRVPNGMTYKTLICHIFPKSVFKSVKTHPLNRWFGTWQCHTTFDQATWSEKMNLPIWPKIEERVKAVIQCISKPELKHLPDELRKLINE